ncbi:MAG: PP2C family protein-serine/threonine phosphatase [Candidatus Nanopelagicales bacterium]
MYEGDVGTGAAAPLRATKAGWGPAQITVLVLVVGLILSLITAWIAWSSDQRNERKLLDVQTQQAAAVLGAQILAIHEPLETTLRVEQATDGDLAEFRAVMGRAVGQGRVFAHASLWDASGAEPRQIDQIGVPAVMDPGQLTGFVARAATVDTFLVTGADTDYNPVSYAIGDPADQRWVVYAERLIPADRIAPVQRTASFARLSFATFIGKGTDPATLVTTNVPPAQLPLTGTTSIAEIPFGDTTLTFQAKASEHLGGDLGWQLPWIFLGIGLALTLITAFAAANIVRSRRRAQLDSETISGLYTRLDGLYAEQRGIAQTLQRALLPAFDPDIAGLDIASRYVAGAAGVDIGGDWYSVIQRGEREVCFVVGDVSGRGIAAAAVMARLRFTIRAYLAEGHSPGTALALCSEQFDIVQDGHMATVVVGVADLATRELRVASAGHFAPLVVSSGDATYVDISPGPPLGVAPTTFDETTTQLPSGATVIAFTDGLIERRGESVDVGLARLADAALVDVPSTEALLDHVVARLTDDASEDDTALLALRWTS